MKTILWLLNLVLFALMVMSIKAQQEVPIIGPRVKIIYSDAWSGEILVTETGKFIKIVRRYE